MKRPVRIVRQPKAQSGFEIKMNPGMGFNANQLSWPVMAGEFSAPDVEVNNTLKPTDWDQANLEAEKGETVVTNLNYDGIPEHYTIGGKRHYEGGTPLNLPPNSFIFSRDRSMRIKDEEILKMFNMTPTKKGYTPADIAKQYNINKYRKILADPNSEDLQRKTAEMMITNYNLKLGKLALVQESLKGFPQGLPMISMPYLQTMNINPEEFAQTQSQPDQTGEEDQARYGKQIKRNLPKHQDPPGQTGNPFADKDGNGLPDYLETNGTVPGLSTTSQKDNNMPYSEGSIEFKRNRGFGNMFGNPSRAKLINEAALATNSLLTNIFNAPEKAAAEERIASKRVGHEMFQHRGGMDMGNYLKDQYAGLHFRPNETGQEYLDPAAMGQMPGMNVKYGGEGSLPQAQLGNLGMFGPRTRVVGMRFNPAMGAYEAINRRGEVIGFFRNPPSQGQFNTGTTAYTTGTPGGSETTTTTKKKVKKQVIPDGAEVIDRSKYNTEEEYIKARDEAFAKAGGKKTVYTKAEDGKYYTVGEGDLFDKGDFEGRLKYLEDKFQDSKIKEALAESIKKAAESKDNLKTTGLTKDEVKNMTADELASEFLEFNKRNINVAKFLQQNNLSYECYDNKGNFKASAKCDKTAGAKYGNLKKVYEAVGLPMDYDTNKKKAALQQLSYIGYKDLIDARKAGKLDKDLTEKLSAFEIDQLGVQDENLGAGKGTSKVSPADAVYTNTTAGQVAGISGKKRKEDLLAETEVEEDVITKENKKAALDYARKTGRAPWFIQDIVKSGKAFADWANIYKDMPYMPTPNVTLPEGVYYDPNAQLAANSQASANILQNLAAFQEHKVYHLELLKYLVRQLKVLQILLRNIII